MGAEDAGNDVLCAAEAEDGVVDRGLEVVCSASIISRTPSAFACAAIASRRPSIRSSAPHSSASSAEWKSGPRERQRCTSGPTASSGSALRNSMMSTSPDASVSMLSKAAALSSSATSNASASRR